MRFSKIFSSAVSDDPLYRTKLYCIRRQQEEATIPWIMRKVWIFRLNASTCPTNPNVIRQKSGTFFFFRFKRTKSIVLNNFIARLCDLSTRGIFFFTFPVIVLYSNQTWDVLFLFTISLVSLYMYLKVSFSKFPILFFENKNSSVTCISQYIYILFLCFIYVVV